MPKPFVKLTLPLLFIALLAQAGQKVSAADRLTGLHSAQVMSQSMPWIAQEAGLFKKYDLDFRLVFIPSSPVATAATLNGDAEIGITGAIGNVRAYVQGFTDLVFIGGVKNFLTHSIVAKPDGDLELPDVLREPLNAQFVGCAMAALAGGQSVEEDLYLVDFPFDGRIVQAEATFVSGSRILIGTRLLSEYSLQINFVSKTVQLNPTVIVVPRCTLCRQNS